MVTSGTAQVHAVADHRRLDHQRHRRGFVQHLLRELERQFVAVDRGLHHQRGGQLVAEHGDDAADRRARPSGGWAVRRPPAGRRAHRSGPAGICTLRCTRLSSGTT
jgi:hypothetical protein